MWGDENAELRAPILRRSLGDRPHPRGSDLELLVAVPGWFGAAYSSVAWFKLRARRTDLLKDVLSRAYVDARCHPGFVSVFNAQAHALHGDGEFAEPYFPGSFVFCHRTRNGEGEVVVTQFDSAVGDQGEKSLEWLGVASGDTIAIGFACYLVTNRVIVDMVSHEGFEPPQDQQAHNLWENGFIDTEFIRTFFSGYVFEGEIVTSNGFMWAGHWWEEIWEVDGEIPAWEVGHAVLPEVTQNQLWNPDYPPHWVLAWEFNHPPVGTITVGEGAEGEVEWEEEEEGSEDDEEINSSGK